LPDHDLSFSAWPKIHAKAVSVALRCEEGAYTMEAFYRHGTPINKSPIVGTTSCENSIPDFHRVIPNFENYKCVSGVGFFTPAYLGYAASCFSDCFSDAFSVKMFMSDEQYKPLVIQEWPRDTSTGFVDRTLVIMGKSKC
jgi:hypothetical protein